VRAAYARREGGRRKRKKKETKEETIPAPPIPLIERPVTYGERKKKGKGKRGANGSTLISRVAAPSSFEKEEKKPKPPSLLVKPPTSTIPYFRARKKKEGGFAIRGGGFGGGGGGGFPGKGKGEKGGKQGGGKRGKPRLARCCGNPGPSALAEKKKEGGRPTILLYQRRLSAEEGKKEGGLSFLSTPISVSAWTRGGGRKKRKKRKGMSRDPFWLPDFSSSLASRSTPCAARAKRKKKKRRKRRRRCRLAPVAAHPSIRKRGKRRKKKRRHRTRLLHLTFLFNGSRRGIEGTRVVEEKKGKREKKKRETFSFNCDLFLKGNTTNPAW